MTWICLKEIFHGSMLKWRYEREKSVEACIASWGLTERIRIAGAGLCLIMSVLLLSLYG